LRPLFGREEIRRSSGFASATVRFEEAKKKKKKADLMLFTTTSLLDGPGATAA
jgi:hypothetical protein